MNNDAALPYDDYMSQRLQDKAFAIAYLNESLAGESDLSAFLVALRRILDAQNLSKSALAKEAGVSREKLYTMLSAKGNPEWHSLKAILDSLGYKLTISA
ncbi:MAG: helix-turn-helix domain-containing protein [Vampirovibrionales bacterium]|nr:helix-turn-helix domain-containing protein [Vampirovibrionales bacterium]